MESKSVGHGDVAAYCERSNDQSVFVSHILKAARDTANSHSKYCLSTWQLVETRLELPVHVITGSISILQQISDHVFLVNSVDGQRFEDASLARSEFASHSFHNCVKLRKVLLPQTGQVIGFKGFFYIEGIEHLVSVHSGLEAVLAYSTSNWKRL